jgi:hypothetical protein
MRSYEAEGKLETRNRVRSIGKQICDYADVEGDGYNPFRNLNGQMIANISTPRPGVTEPRDVTRVFKLISAPWTRATFGDVVGLNAIVREAAKIQVATHAADTHMEIVVPVERHAQGRPADMRGEAGRLVVGFCTSLTAGNLVLQNQCLKVLTLLGS